ncbi:hypothetical protein PHMEG_00021575 [Phytophthora megakarya]|uniref:Uncharacterized protein n=1 Tax=Phytophthora megakarya TaxID=4795 RepID=A0A225VKV7_9STRA|nr:hypothetical protein PHMEG_00021575 [Phytophthora megakarya]
MSLLTWLAEVNGNDKTVASVPSHLYLAFAQVDNIDTYLATTLSDLAVRARLSLAVLVPIYVRGQTDADGRPNKALYEVPIQYNTSRRSSTSSGTTSFGKASSQRGLSRSPKHNDTVLKITNVPMLTPLLYDVTIAKVNWKDGISCSTSEYTDCGPKCSLAPSKGADDTRMTNDY